MSRVCPKCHYHRQPIDNNPDWQCPSCHVAYDKVIPPGDVAGAYRARRSYSEAPQSTSFFGKGVLALLLAVLAFIGYRHYPDFIVPQASAAPPEIILYGTEWCGYCAQARQFFDQHGIEYQELDVDRSFEAKTEFRRLGGTGVPLFVIDGEVVRGWREDDMRASLRPWLQ